MVKYTLFIITLIVSTNCFSATYTWDLHSTEFGDGGSAIGQFNFNSSTGQCEHINITVTGPLFNGDSAHFNDRDTVKCTKTSIDVCETDCSGGSKYFRLEFNNPLTPFKAMITTDFSGIPDKGSYYGYGAFSSSQGVVKGTVITRTAHIIMDHPVQWSDSGGRDADHSGNPNYTFNINHDATVTFDLESTVDTYLYLLSANGDLIAYDDDGGDGYNSRLSHLLQPGTYRLVTGTYHKGEVGNGELRYDDGHAVLNDSEYSSLRFKKKNGSPPENSNAGLLLATPNDVWANLEEAVYLMGTSDALGLTNGFALVSTPTGHDIVKLPGVSESLYTRFYNSSILECQDISIDELPRAGRRDLGAFKLGKTWEIGDEVRVITYSIDHDVTYDPNVPENVCDWDQNNQKYDCELDTPANVTEREEIIDRAFADWSAVDFGIKFEKLTSPKWAEAAIRIVQKQISYESLTSNRQEFKSEADRTFLGTAILDNTLEIPNVDNANMNLGFRKGLSTAYTTALHEIGHALGLVHEHQRGDTGIVWNKEGCYEYFATRPHFPLPRSKKSESAIHYSAFKIEEKLEYVMETYELGQQDLLSTRIRRDNPWDEKSVMNYDFGKMCFDAPKSLKENGITRSTTLTEFDKGAVRFLYPKPR